MKSLTLLSVLFITSCSYMPTWIGGVEEGKKLKGERISVLDYETPLKAESDSQNLLLNLPAPALNKNWLRSSGYHKATIVNSTIGLIDKQTKQDIGKAAKKGNFLSATPVISDRKIITLDSKGLVSAFNVENIKKPIWQTSLADKKDDSNYFAAGGLTIYLDKLFVNTGSDKIIALDISNGREIWQRQLQNITRSAPEAHDGKLFINTLGNKLYALNAENGGLIWTHSGFSQAISIFGAAPPVAYEKLVFASYSSGELYALRSENGEELWLDSFDNDINNTKFLLNDIDASPLINGDLIYTTSNDGYFVASEIATGKRVWQKEISSINTPWIAGDNIYIIDNQKRFIALNKNTSDIIWVNNLAKYKNKKTKRGEIRYASPVMADSKLYVVNSLGKLLVFDPKTGDMLKKHKIIKDVYLSPVIAHNKMFLLNNDAKLLSLGN